MRVDGADVEATIEVYRVADGELIEETRADPTFELTIDSLDGKVLTAYQSESVRPWFTTRPPDRRGEFFSLGGTEPLILDQQLLFGPDGGDEDYGVTVWRWVDPTETSINLFYIEIVTKSRDLSKAMFSLTLPEDILVAYEGGEGEFAAPVGILANSVREQVAKWYPVQDPQLPTHEMVPSWTNFDPFRNYEQKQTAQEGTNRIVMTALGTIPIIGGLTNLVETLDWATQNQINNIIGDKYADPDATVNRPTQNTHDTVTRPWVDDLFDFDQPKAKALVFEVPMQFQNEDPNAQSLDMIVEAEWNKTNRFGKRIGGTDSKTPTPSPTAEKETEGNWSQYLYDAANTGFNPNATGPSKEINQYWNTKIDDILTGIVVGNQTAFVAAGSQKDSRPGAVYAFDFRNDKQLWKFEAGEASQGANPAVLDNTVYFGVNSFSEDTVYAVDVSSGEKVWSAGAGGDADGVTVLNNVVYVATLGGDSVFAYDAATGDELWRFGRRNDHSIIAAVDDTVYTAYNPKPDPRIYALDSNTGEVRWQVPLNERPMAGVAVANGTVFTGTQEGRVIAIDTDNQSIKWRFNAGSQVFTPAIASGRVYVPTSRGDIFALDLATGNKQWQATVGGRAMPPGVANGTVYIGSQDGYLYALTASNGKEEWRFEIGGDVKPPAVIGDLVFACSSNGDIYALR